MNKTKKYIKMSWEAQGVDDFVDNWDIDAGSWCWCSLTPDESPVVISHETIVCDHRPELSIAVLNWTPEIALYEEPLKAQIAHADFKKYPIKYWIWLPRIDQLINMLIPDYFDCSVGVMMGLMEDWDIDSRKKHNDRYISQFLDMEMLLLVYVMMIKYNKIWNDKIEKWKENL